MLLSPANQPSLPNGNADSRCRRSPFPVGRPSRPLPPSPLSQWDGPHRHRLRMTLRLTLPPWTHPALVQLVVRAFSDSGVPSLLPQKPIPSRIGTVFVVHPGVEAFTTFPRIAEECCSVISVTIGSLECGY